MPYHIWKLSLGALKPTKRSNLAEKRLASIHSKTGANQVPHFKNVPDGTLFYLTYGNAVKAICRFSGPVSNGDEGWLHRPYELLKSAKHSTRYQKSAKKWTPNGNSTFFKVPETDLGEFAQTLLKPYFDISVEDLMKLEPIDTVEDEHIISGTAHIDDGPLNRILFGPPGTGKTYHAISEAVSIIEALDVLQTGSPAAYPSTKLRFDRYREDGLAIYKPSVPTLCTLTGTLNLMLGLRLGTEVSAVSQHK